MKLPTEKDKPTGRFEDKIIIFYGLEKIGKSTFCSKLPDALMVDTEDGLRSLEAYKYRVKNWTDFLELLHSLETENHFYKTVVIDTADKLYEYCEEFVCKKEHITDPADKEYGVGWRAVKREFVRQINRLSALDLGLVFVSHAQEKEDKEFRKNRITTTMTAQASRVIEPMADYILYAHMDLNENRIIGTKPTTQYMAGCRGDTGNNRLPSIIPLDTEALLKYFYANSNYEDGAGDEEQQAEDDVKARTNLVESIHAGEQYLSDGKIDGFDVPKRVENSRQKHLKSKSFEDASLVELQGYLHHLRTKAKEQKKNGKSK